jgi:hypothetical protein
VSKEERKKERKKEKKERKKERKNLRCANVFVSNLLLTEIDIEPCKKLIIITFFLLLYDLHP